MIAATVVLAALTGGWNYVTAAYAVTIVALMAYAVWVIVRGRRVGRQLPPEDRRWM
ncbi:MAG: heme exporter protein CcmD [Acidimicrobiales bacterium]